MLHKAEYVGIHQFSMKSNRFFPHFITCLLDSSIGIEIVWNI